MKKNIIFLLLIVAGIIWMSATVKAQEFPIANGSDSTSSGGMAFDGTNYLIGILGDRVSPNSITAQLTSTNGSLVGSRISLGVSGGMPLFAFDGTNYLMVWSNTTKDTVYGQFINTSGNLKGTHFLIATNATFSPPKGGCIAFGDTTYMVVYKENNINYGQRINKSGGLIGTPTQISFNEAGDNIMTYDGTNYLVAWWAHNTNLYLYGQFISKSGVLVGSNFIIDGPHINDNSPSMAFDGSRYLVVFRGNPETNSACLFARFVTTSGSVATNRITVCDSTKNPGFPSISFDGSDFLITWADNFFTSSSAVRGRFFNTSGVPIDTVFTIFNKLNNKVPIYGGQLFGNNKFLIITTRLDTINLSDGDVYGKFIQSSVNGIIEIKNRKMLFNFYPNPASDIVTLKTDNTDNADMTLNIYSVIGTLVKSEILRQNNRQINTGDLSNGVYMITIKSKDITETEKLVIQH